MPKISTNIQDGFIVLSTADGSEVSSGTGTASLSVNNGTAWTTATTYGNGKWEFISTAGSDTGILHVKHTHSTGVSSEKSYDLYDVTEFQATGFSTLTTADVRNSMNDINTDVEAILEDTGVTLQNYLTDTLNANVVSNGVAISNLNDVSTAQINALLGTLNDISTSDVNALITAGFDEIKGATWTTADALDQLGGSGGATTAQIDTLLDNQFAIIKGGTFSTVTDTLEAIRNAVDSVGATIGSGANSITIDIETTAGANAGAGIDVWVNTNSSNSQDAVVAGPVQTDAQGQVTFLLDNGTYYVWAQKSGLNFSNPQTLTVSL